MSEEKERVGDGKLVRVLVAAKAGILGFRGRQGKIWAGVWIRALQLDSRDEQGS